MKQFIILLFGVFLLSCSNELKEKKIQDEINGLKEKISKQKDELKLKGEKITIIEGANKHSPKEIKGSEEWLNEVIDRYKTCYAIDVMKPDNVFTDFYNTINYEITADDTYSKRGVYYTSEKSNEHFYNVRTSIVDNEIRFFFMGIEYPLEEEDFVVTIYELDENKQLYIIDTIDLTPSFKENKDYEYSLQVYLDEFMLMQADNLILKDSLLYYSKTEKIIPKGEAGFMVSRKQFFKYRIGSKQESMKIEDEVLSNTIINTSNCAAVLNSDKSKAVVNYSGNIFFCDTQNWGKIGFDIYNFDFDYEQLPKIDFDFNNELKYDKDNYNLIDNDNNDIVLAGNVSWHPKKNIIYFGERKRELYFQEQISNYSYIWQIDLDNNKVKKLIPENGAINPYCFQVDAKDYITYVKGGSIMLCELETNDTEF